MRGGINRDNLGPKLEDTTEIRRQANIFLHNRNLFKEMRTAYMRGLITKDELLTIRGKAKAGDVDGATKGLARLVGRSYSGI